MPRSKGRQRRSAEEVRELVEQFRESGLSRLAFAKRVRVHPNTVSNWLRREAQDGASQRVVPVRLKLEPRDPEGEIEIVLRSGLRLRARRGFDREVLLDLLAVLDPPC